MDAEGNFLNQVGNSYNPEKRENIADALNPVHIGSALPAEVVVSIGGQDELPVSFQYGNQQWNSKSPQCNSGGFENGFRQGDCGFTCN